MNGKLQKIVKATAPKPNRSRHFPINLNRLVTNRKLPETGAGTVSRRQKKTVIQKALRDRKLEKWYIPPLNLITGYMRERRELPPARSLGRSPSPAEIRFGAVFNLKIRPAAGERIIVSLASESVSLRRYSILRAATPRKLFGVLASAA